MEGADLFALLQISRGRFLGAGVSSSVYQGTMGEGADKEDVAAKVVGIADSDMNTLFTSEINILCRLSHPSIVRMITAAFDHKTGVLVTGYCPNGTLGAKLGMLENADVLLGYMLDIGSALDYIHQHLIFHRDVKPDNILLNAQGRAVLADFGLSGQLADSNGFVTSWDSTPSFIGPEVGTHHQLSPFKVK